MEQTKLRAGVILANATRHFASHRMLVVLTLAGLLLSSLFNIRILMVAILSYAQFELTYEILADEDLMAGGYGKRRFFAVFALQVITSLLFLIGWILLILPGVYLILRLCLSVPALIAEEAGVLEALMISWRRTARQELALLGAVAAAMVPTLISWACVFGFIAMGWMGATVIATLTTVVISGLTLIFCWCIAAAAYAETCGTTRDLEEVFA